MLVNAIDGQLPDGTYIGYVDMDGQEGVSENEKVYIGDTLANDVVLILDDSCNNWCVVYLISIRRHRLILIVITENKP